MSETAPGSGTSVDAPIDVPVDVLVIGGGIHGAGVLQAAAAAGHSALLVEERAIAFGTSSRSSKLIHGGLRYLETLQFGLVRESLAERSILLRIAPHLVRLVPFFLPIYRGTTRRPWEIRAGLSLYALLGGLSSDARFARVPRAQWTDLDGLATEGLEAVFRYHDAQTDDAALARAVVRSAAELGANVVCPGRFVEAARAGEGYEVRLEEGGRERVLHARTLVNASGPWIDEVQRRIAGSPAPLAIELVQGAHVELEGELRRGVYYAEAPDRRAVFLMPWKGHTLVGTTETPFAGDPDDVRATPEEIEYLENTLRRYFPRHSARRLDAWAGLRVLPRGSGRAFDRPRDVTFLCDRPRAPRLVAIYGGKLTGYRATAAKVLGLLRASLPPARREADTATLPLPQES